MRPKREQKQPQRELFQVDLEQLIDMNHSLVRLGLLKTLAPFRETADSCEYLDVEEERPGQSARI